MLGHKERNQLECGSSFLTIMYWCASIAFSTYQGCVVRWLLLLLRRWSAKFDPEVAIRLMLAGLLTGFVHDRKLMRESHVNLAIRWFAGYGFTRNCLIIRA